MLEENEEREKKKNVFYAIAEKYCKKQFLDLKHYACNNFDFADFTSKKEIVRFFRDSRPNFFFEF